MKKPYIIRYGKIYIQTTIQGKRYRFATGLVANKENERFVCAHLLEFILNFNNGKLQPRAESCSQSAKTSCANVQPKKTLEFYLKQILKDSSLMKQTTQDSYKTKARDILNFFGNQNIEDISREDINAFYDYLLGKGNKQSIIKSKANLLKRAFNIALDEGEISRNVVFNKKGLNSLPKRDKKPFSLEEIRRILSRAKYYSRDFRNYLQLAFFSGMREGEILALKFSNIDFGKDSLRIDSTINTSGITTPKTKTSIREIDLLPLAKVSLLSQREFHAQREFVFLDSAQDYRNTLKSFYATWKELLIECGLEYRTLYSTRHSFASVMLNAGEDLMWVSRKMLGHKDVSMTLNIYADYIPTKERHAKFLDNFSIEETQTNPKEAKENV